MKKKRIKFKQKVVFIVHIDPYRQDCIVVCNGEFQDAYKFIKKIKGKTAQAVAEYLENKKDLYPNEIVKGAAGRLYTELPHGYIMMFNHGDDWRSTVNTVLHESLHLTHYILRRAGITLVQESEESFTYLLGHIVQEILEKIY